jgi:hypothetical protein
MPAIPTPVFILKSVVQTTVSNYANVSYWVPTVPPTSGSDVQDICNQFFAELSVLYDPILNAANYFQGCVGTYKDGATEYVGSSTTAPVAGGLNNTAVGDEVAAVIRKNTGLSGRDNRGRYFLSGLDSSVFSTTNPNEIDSTTYLGLLQSLASYYGTDATIGAATFHARHWNRKTSTLVPISACSVASRLASARARRRHSFDLSL